MLDFLNFAIFTEKLQRDFLIHAGKNPKISFALPVLNGANDVSSHEFLQGRAELRWIYSRLPAIWLISATTSSELFWRIEKVRKMINFRISSCLLPFLRARFSVFCLISVADIIFQFAIAGQHISKI